MKYHFPNRKKYPICGIEIRRELTNKHENKVNALYRVYTIK